MSDRLFRAVVVVGLALSVAFGAVNVFAPPVQPEARGAGDYGQYGSVQIVGNGNLKVGDGTPDNTLAGEDAYIEGFLEVDGALDADSTANIEGAVTLQSTLDVASTVNYGSDDLYPVGYASSGQQLVYGTDEITDTITVDHGLSTVTFCMATLGADADTDAGDPVVVTTLVSSNDCTVKAWQDDWSAAETAEDVHWLVIGAP